MCALLWSHLTPGICRIPQNHLPAWNTQKMAKSANIILKTTLRKLSENRIIFNSVNVIALCDSVLWNEEPQEEWTKKIVDLNWWLELCCLDMCCPCPIAMAIRGEHRFRATLLVNKRKRPLALSVSWWNFEFIEFDAHLLKTGVGFFSSSDGVWRSYYCL